ncbi:hypothetical protein M407DRAFT_11306 [Tulasnella calospora MUT 4182]|uniref:Uncharacterized protein n=1 Tax=Tulasnella calospora MUT 4182 TaxID=1051891 RepID=A0A0C3KDT5_9AGAM|nr:hypothetical protein M407DRAFT_11306 [Tulasnella calospora MUT 4182]
MSRSRRSFEEVHKLGRWWRRGFTDKLALEREQSGFNFPHYALLLGAGWPNKGGTMPKWTTDGIVYSTRCQQLMQFIHFRCQYLVSRAIEAKEMVELMMVAGIVECKTQEPYMGVGLGKEELSAVVLFVYSRCLVGQRFRGFTFSTVDSKPSVSELLQLKLAMDQGNSRAVIHSGGSGFQFGLRGNLQIPSVARPKQRDLCRLASNPAHFPCKEIGIGIERQRHHHLDTILVMERRDHALSDIVMGNLLINEYYEDESRDSSAGDDDAVWLKSSRGRGY